MSSRLKLIFHFFISIAIGAGIYLLFRPQTLLVFKWIKIFGIEEILFLRNVVDVNTPKWFIYSLPDGLWVYGSTILMWAIWHDKFVFWLYIPIICALLTEVLQMIGSICGTFCLIDVVFYLAGFLCAVIHKREVYLEV